MNAEAKQVLRETVKGKAGKSFKQLCELHRELEDLGLRREAHDLLRIIDKLMLWINK